MSLISQRHHLVVTRRSAGRDIGSEHRAPAEQQRRAHEGDRVQRRDAEQQRAQRACRQGRAGRSQDQPAEHQPQVLLEQQPHHLGGPGTDGHAQAQLARPLRDRVRRDAVDADQREHHRQRREQGEQRHAESPRRRRARQRLIQAHEIADRLLGIELPHGGAHRARQRQRGTLGLEHDPHLGRALPLELRHIQLQHWRGIERGVANVPDRTDDRRVVSAAAEPRHREGPPQRILPRPQLVGEPPVHDDDFRGVCPVLRREVAAPEPDAHRREVARTHHAQPRREVLLGGVGTNPPWIERQDVHAARERQRAGHAHGRHAGIARQHVRQILEELGLHRGIRVARGREPDARRQHVARVVAGIHRGQPHEAPDEQPRAHQQHERERDLRHHQPALRPVAPARARRGAALVAQRLLHAGARRAQRRQQAERQARHEREDEGEGEYPGVEPDLVHARHARPDGERGGEAPAGQQHARGPSDERHHHALGQELPRQPHAIGAERPAHGDLLPALGGARHVQPRRVGAGDQQHQPHRAEQHQQGRADVLHTFHLQRIDAEHHAGRDGDVGVGAAAPGSRARTGRAHVDSDAPLAAPRLIPLGGADAPRHHTNVGARLRERGARRQACHGLESVEVAVERELRIGAQRLAQRHPQLGTLVGEREAAGHDAHNREAVAVMPRGFAFPNEGTQLWVPLGEALRSDPQLAFNRHFYAFQSVARLTAGATLAQARADVGVVARRISAAERDQPGGGERRIGINMRAAGPGPGPGGGGPNPNVAIAAGMVFGVDPLKVEGVEDVRSALLVLFGAVGLVLLIACANAAGLYVARATERRKEVAVRRALGADRMRLARQFLTESVVVALIAGAAGVLLARWGLPPALAVWPRVPRVNEIGLDPWVLAFALVLSLVTGLAFGLLPALRAAGPGVEQALRDEGGATTGSRRRHRTQRGLVVAEIALALVLLVGSGLLIRSFVRLTSVDPGYDTRDVLAARIRLTPSRYADPTVQTQFFQDLTDVLARNPGVAAVSVSRTLPLTGGVDILAFDPRRIRPDATEEYLAARLSVVGPGYFAAMGIRLRGRDFTPQDRADAPKVVIMNRRLSDELWPGQDPLGRTFPVPRLGGGGYDATVIGTIGDIRYASLDATPMLELYVPQLQRQGAPEMWVVLKAKRSPLALAGAVRAAVRQLDPQQPIGDLVGLDQALSRSTAARRLSMTLLTLFAALAVVLALIGIYGITAYAATQRTRELGLRMAIGARPGAVVGLLLKENLWLVLGGLVLGTTGATLATRALRSMLFGVSPLDAITFIGAALVP